MKSNEEKENKQILNAYRGILRSMKSSRSKNETREIRKAFDEGFTFVILGSDLFVLTSWSQEVNMLIKNLHEV